MPIGPGPPPVTAVGAAGGADPAADALETGTDGVAAADAGEGAWLAAAIDPGVREHCPGRPGLRQGPRGRDQQRRPEPGSDGHDAQEECERGAATDPGHA